MIIKKILKVFVNSIYSILILYFLNIPVNYAMVGSNEATETEKASHNGNNNSLTNNENKQLIFINRRTTSFSKIKKIIPRLHSTLKRKKSKNKSNNSFQAYINNPPEEVTGILANVTEHTHTTEAIVYTDTKTSTDSFNSESLEIPNNLYETTAKKIVECIPGKNVCFNRFIGKVIQVTSNNQPYLIETQAESPDIDSYTDMSYYFINRVGSCIPKQRYMLFYRGYYAPQIIILGLENSDPDDKNNKIINKDEYCMYETIYSTSCKKLINYMMLRIGEPFKNIHNNIEIEPHSYYIRGMYLSICILKKIQITIIYPEKYISHNVVEINNFNYKHITDYLKKINFPTLSIDENIADEYNDYEQHVLSIIERQRQIFDVFNTLVLYLGNTSLYGLKVVNIKSDDIYIKALNKLKFSIYSFDSKKPEDINIRKVRYQYKGYYILAVTIFLTNQQYTRYIKIIGFNEATSENFNLITDTMKVITDELVQSSSEKLNTFVMLLSLLVCYDAGGRKLNTSSTIRKNNNDFSNSLNNNLQFELSEEFNDLSTVDHLDEPKNKKSVNHSKLENMYENFDVCLRANQHIEEIYDINNIIQDTDLIAISMPTLLIINIESY